MALNTFTTNLFQPSKTRNACTQPKLINRPDKVLDNDYAYEKLADNKAIIVPVQKRLLFAATSRINNVES